MPELTDLAHLDLTHLQEGFDFIRKGIVGDYLNYFTADQYQAMSTKLKELQRYGIHLYDQYCT